METFSQRPVRGHTGSSKMPAAIIPILLSTALTAGASYGISKLESPGGPSSSDVEAQMKQQATADAQKQEQAEAAQRGQALRRAAPDAQAQTGGSLTDAPFASLTSYIAGAPSNLQEALRALGMDKDQSQQQPELAFSGGS